MSSSLRPPSDPFAPRRRFEVRFRLSTLLAAMMLFTIVAWVLGGLLRESKVQQQPSNLPLYVVLTIAAPVLVMVLLNIVNLVRQWLARRPPADQQAGEDKD